MPKQISNHRGPKGQTDIGKKIATPTAKKPPMPESSKVAAKKMAELMTRKVSHTQAMREQKQKKAKYR